MRKELARLERELDKLERQERDLHDALAEHATDYVRIGELNAELRSVQERKQATEESWLELSDS